MEATKKKKFLSAAKSRPVFVWGARMTGLGALRWCGSNQISVSGFIDSDASLYETKVGGLNVQSPQKFREVYEKQVPRPVILLAVSLKEFEIQKIISLLGFAKEDVFSFQSTQTPHFSIDIIGTCNLKCSSCPHSIEGHDTPGGMMSFDNFVSVIDKVTEDHPSTSHISLYSWGDPFLHPQVDKMVKYIHSKNIAVALSSNLSFNFENKLINLIMAEPDYLKVSVSGYFPEAYNNTHSGGDINLVKSNLYKIRHILDKFKKNIFVEINYHLYRDNNGKNLKEFRRLASELGFALSTTYALIMPLERVIDHLNGNPDFQTMRLHDNLLVTIDEGITAATKNGKMNDGCPFRENQVIVNADLTVPICCTVFSRKGNIVAQNFLEASPSEILKNKSNCKTCDRCEALGLPEYNMGFNQAEWDRIAATKEGFDD